MANVRIPAAKSTSTSRGAVAAAKALFPAKPAANPVETKAPVNRAIEALTSPAFTPVQDSATSYIPGVRAPLPTTIVAKRPADPYATSRPQIPQIPTPEYARPKAPASPPQSYASPASGGGGGGSSSGPSGPAYASPAYQPEPEPEYYDAAPYDASLPPDSGGGGGGGGYGYGSPSGPEPEPAYQNAGPVLSTSTAMVPVSSAPPVIVPTETVGIFTRIWRFFFGAPKTLTPAVGATVRGGFFGDPSNTQEAAASSLVRRARAGDQNAMATLNLIRENAAKGEPKAVSMYDLLCAYIRHNPVGMPSQAASKSFAAAVRLSHSDLLDNSRIQEYAATMPEDEEEAFVDGMYQRPAFGSDPRIRRANFMGRTVGLARRLQAVRMPHSQISNYDQACAWELGE